MKIAGWTCIVGAGGTSRAASHPDNGNAVWIQGRLMGNCDMPKEVFAWLIQPELRMAWDTGALATTLVGDEASRAINPFADEPPNKDNDPS